MTQSPQNRPVAGSGWRAILAVAGLVSVLAVHGAAAQLPGPPPVGPFPPVAPPAKLDDVVIKGAAAERAGDRSLLRYDVAEKIAKVCFAQAARNNLGVTVYILDQFGDTIYAGRMDGQTSINMQTALMKARSTLYTRRPTHASQNSSTENMMNELRSMQLDIYPVSGALPIVVEKQFLGAIGVGGGRMDEACAFEALQTVLGPQPALPPDLPPRAR